MTAGCPADGCSHRPALRGGQVKLRVTESPNEPPAGKVSGTYYMVGMQYNINQQLWLLRLAEKDETGVTKTFAREYRYDGDGRVRYYERDRDPDDLAPVEGVEKWREFLGSSVYSDLDVVEDGGDLTSQKSRRRVASRRFSGAMPTPPA